MYKKIESVDDGVIETEEVYCDKGEFFSSSIWSPRSLLSIKCVIISELSVTPCYDMIFIQI